MSDLASLLVLFTSAAILLPLSFQTFFDPVVSAQKWIVIYILTIALILIAIVKSHLIKIPKLSPALIFLAGAFVFNDLRFTIANKIHFYSFSQFNRISFLVITLLFYTLLNQAGDYSKVKITIILFAAATAAVVSVGGLFQFLHLLILGEVVLERNTSTFTNVNLAAQYAGFSFLILMVAFNCSKIQFASVTF